MVPLQRNNNTPNHPISEAFFALILLILVLPILFAVAASIRLLDSGPIYGLFKTTDQQGQIVQVYRFSLPENPGLREFLLETRLVSLPQLINVIKGELGLWECLHL